MFSIQGRLALGLGAAVLAGTGLAHAHASLETTEAPAGSTYRAVLRIPHGCDGEATHTVRVELPDGFYAAKPMPKAGWTLDITIGAYAQPFDNHGDAMTEGPRVLTWSGGDLPDAFYDEFVFRGQVGDLPAGTRLAFPTTQLCANGEVAWVEIPADGEDAHALGHPAPLLTVSEPTGGDHPHGDHGPMAMDGMQVGDLTVSGAFARASVVATSAAYLSIANAGDADDRLVAASSPAAGRVELHTMAMNDGVMQMTPLADGVPVPAHGAATLAPGGMHVMLLDLHGPLQEGGMLTLTLVFEHAGTLTVDVPILRPGAGVEDMERHMHGQ
ncbi:MAG: DUF1775 domain-containing protein [Alphaproteobacteria bacterium]